MAKKTVITKVLDVNNQDGVIEFPQNRTLYVDQFTDEAPSDEDEMKGFQARNVAEVFEKYTPKKEVELEDEDGEINYEDFIFTQLKDFSEDALIQQSETMSMAKDKIEAYNSIVEQLKKNKKLRDILKDPSARQGLVDVLKAMRDEIEGN
ncbi:MAG: hypothetical protein J1D77_00850 [Muribaculaceae bacterium]|nr:hypothetical protein [Muribaculaceae bacterium]